MKIGIGLGLTNGAFIQTPPPAPVLLTAEGLTFSVYLTWSEVPGATKYRIERSADGGQTWQVGPEVVPALPAAPAYEDTSTEIIPGVTYQWAVRAYDGAWSARSNAISAAAGIPNGADVEALWDMQTGADSQIVQDLSLGSDGGEYDLIVGQSAVPDAQDPTEVAGVGMRIGGGTYLRMNEPLPALDDLTIGLLIRREAAPTATSRVFFGEDAGVKLEIQWLATGQLQFKLFDGTAKSLTVPDPGNVWLRVIFTRQGTTANVYVDGVLSDTDAAYKSTQLPAQTWKVGDGQTDTMVALVGVWSAVAAGGIGVLDAYLAAYQHARGLENLALDKWAGSVAYTGTLRKVLGAYGGQSERVRRSSDSTEQDIGFAGTDYDTAAHDAFVSGGQGYAVTVYDQSGTARDAGQITAADQPEVVAGPGGRRVWSFAGAQGLTIPGLRATIDGTTGFTAFVVARQTGGTGRMTVFCSGRFSTPGWSATPFSLVFNGSALEFGTRDSALVERRLTVTLPLVIGTWYVIRLRYDAAGVQDLWVDGVQKASVASTGNPLNVSDRDPSIGRNGGLAESFVGDVAEVLYFDDVLTDADCATIEANLTAYYGL